LKSSAGWSEAEKIKTAVGFPAIAQVIGQLKRLQQVHIMGKVVIAGIMQG